MKVLVIIPAYNEQDSIVSLIQEVKEYSPEPVEELTFGQRIARGFLDSCADAWEAIQDFIVGFVSILPMLLVILLILAIIFFIVFGIVKAIIAIVKKSSQKRAVKKPKQTARPVAQVVQNKPEIPADKADRENAENK